MVFRQQPAQSLPAQDVYKRQERYAGITAEAVARAAEQIWESRGRQCALVSLARAGTPIGILIRRYLQGRYGADLPHYTISIIRGRGRCV